MLVVVLVTVADHGLFSVPESANCISELSVASFRYKSLRVSVPLVVIRDGQEGSIIIIMYIYHAFINTLSAHIIFINLNMIFCTYVEHTPTKTIYIKDYTETHTHTALNSNVYDTDVYHTCAHTHARTHTNTC